MKKILLAYLGSLLIFANAQAGPCCDLLSTFNNGQFYAEIFGGANFFDVKSNSQVSWKPGYVISGSLGYRLCNGLRLEIEHAYRQNALKNSRRYSLSFFRSQSFSYMFNVLYERPLFNLGCAPFCNVQIFSGFGIGYDVRFSTMRYRSSYYSKGQQYTYKCGGLAWQGIVGISSPIFCNTDLSLEYRFHRASFQNAYNHAVGLGLTYSFGS